MTFDQWKTETLYLTCILCITDQIQIILHVLWQCLFYSRPTTSSTTRNSYKGGAAVKSVKLFPENSVTPERIGTVVLPQRILGGECLSTAPVRYLTDLDTHCNFRLTREMCTSGSVFSARFYMESSRIRDPACPNSFSVLGKGCYFMLRD